MSCRQCRISTLVLLLCSLLGIELAIAASWAATGWTANRIEYSRQGKLLGEFHQDERGWVEVNNEGREFRYEETGRDDDSIDLFDRSRNMRVEMDINARQIWYTQNNGPRRLLYDMWSAYAGNANAQGGAGTCRASIQGRIAWDYQGNTRWREDNMRELCAGAENSAEPARCFQQALHGGINWGGGTQWEWANAIALCHGTRNARQTIGCFEEQIDQGYSWQEAIGECGG